MGVGGRVGVCVCGWETGRVGVCGKRGRVGVVREGGCLAIHRRVESSYLGFRNSHLFFHLRSQPFYIIQWVPFIGQIL